MLYNSDRVYHLRKMKISRSSIISSIVIICGLLLFFLSLSKGSLVNSDDAIYAEIIKQILKRGEWLNLYWQDYNYLTKPPLFFWMGALSAKLFSLEEFALRLPAAVFGFLTFISVYFYVRKESGNLAAVISSLILASFTLFLNLSRRVMLDVPMVFFITLSILSFLMARKDRRWFYVAWISAGLAFLIKGYVFFPALAVPVIYFLIYGDWKSLISKQSVKGIAAMLLLVLPWQLYSMFNNPASFKTKFFKQQIVDHYTGAGLDFFHKPFYFYMQRFYELDRYIFYFSMLALLVFIAYGLKDRLKKYMVFFIWVALYMLVFSFSSSKLDHYIIGMYPAIAIFIGMVFGDVNFPKKRMISVIMIIVVCMTTLFTFAPYTSSKSWEIDPSGGIKKLTKLHNKLSKGAGKLFVYRIYLPGPIFYSEAEVRAVESDKKIYELLSSIGEFKQNDRIKFVPLTELASLWQSVDRFYCLIREQDKDKFVQDNTEKGKLRIIAKEGKYALISNRPQS